MRFAPGISACLAMALAAACAGGGEADERAACRSGAGPRHVLVFLDRSDSTEGDRATHEVFQDSLHALLDRTIRCPGDEITAFLVHARTRGKAYRVSVRHGIELPDTRGSRIELARDSLRYMAALEKLRQQGWSRLRSLIDSTEIQPRLSLHTDLLGTIEVISEEFRDAPANAIKRVYYFSDMYESMPGPDRRDFDSDPPGNPTEAEAWARADAALVRGRMHVDPARFEDIGIRVLLGHHGNRQASDAVKFYWLRLFSELGVSLESVRYN